MKVVLMVMLTLYVLITGMLAGIILVVENPRLAILAPFWPIACVVEFIKRLRAS